MLRRGCGVGEVERAAQETGPLQREVGVLEKRESEFDVHGHVDAFTAV